MNRIAVAQELVKLAKELTGAMNYAVASGNWHGQITVQRLRGKGDSVTIDGLVSLQGLGGEEQERFSGLKMGRAGMTAGSLWSRNSSTGSEHGDWMFDKIANLSNLSSVLDEMLEGEN